MSKDFHTCNYSLETTQDDFLMSSALSHRIKSIVAARKAAEPESNSLLNQIENHYVRFEVGGTGEADINSVDDKLDQYALPEKNEINTP